MTLVPVLCALLLGGQMHGEGVNPVRLLTWVYRPLLRWALRHRVLTLSAAVWYLLGLSRWCRTLVGSSCLPQRG